jgi:hypothetical protein
MLPPVRIWILTCACATLAGWTLSCVGQLNRAGYGIVFAVTTLAIFLWPRKNKILSTFNFPF